MVLSWTAPVPPDGCNLMRYKISVSTGEEILSLRTVSAPGWKEEWQLDDLPEGAVCSVTIFAVGSCVAGELRSLAVTFPSLHLPGPPPPPTALVCDNIEKTSARITWDTPVWPHGTLRSYDLHVWVHLVEGAPRFHRETVDHPTQFKVLEYLQTGMSGSVEIVAFGDYRGHSSSYSVQSKAVPFDMIRLLPPSLPAPTSLLITPNSTTSARLGWTAPTLDRRGCHLTHYEVFLDSTNRSNFRQYELLEHQTEGSE